MIWYRHIMHSYALTSFMFASVLWQMPYVWKQQRPRQFWEVIVVNHLTFFLCTFKHLFRKCVYSIVYVHVVLSNTQCIYPHQTSVWVFIYIYLFIYLSIYLGYSIQHFNEYPWIKSQLLKPDFTQHSYSIEMFTARYNLKLGCTIWNDIMKNYTAII